MLHNKLRCFEPQSGPEQCRQPGLHRGRNAKVALESAESADPGSTNAAARGVLGEDSTFDAVPDFFRLLFQALGFANPAPCGALTATEDPENRRCTSTRIRFGQAASNRRNGAFPCGLSPSPNRRGRRKGPTMKTNIVTYELPHKNSLTRWRLPRERSNRPSSA